jgi:hypothetical protein
MRYVSIDQKQKLLTIKTSDQIHLNSPKVAKVMAPAFPT